MATSERLKMAFNSDQIRFRDNYLDRYEDNWYNVSTLKLDANQYGFKKPIDDFQRRYLALDKELKDLLKPFQIKEKIEYFKRKYTPYVTIERLGDKDTWKKIDKSKEELRYFEERIRNASIIVCMVQVVYDKGIVCITKPSSDLLQKCLAVQPYDTEIVIITEPGIHATESKSIVYKTLEEKKVKLPKAVHHAAEIDIRDIVLGRVNLLMKAIGKLATTLIESIPDSIRTSVFVIESFEEHTSEQYISTVARKINLKDGDSYIGNANDLPLYYYNEFKIRDIKQQLIKECSETVVDQLIDDIGNKISHHIADNVQLSDYMSSFYHNERFGMELFINLLHAINSALGPLLAILFAPILLFITGTIVVATAVFRVFFPVNVNDPSWRIKCVSVVVTNFQTNKKKIISTISSSLNQTSSNMTKGLHVLTLKGYDPYNYQHYDDRDYLLYSKSTYKDHKTIKKNYQVELGDTELEQHTVKIVVGSDQSVTIYSANETKSTTENPISHTSQIKLKQITETTDENKRIYEYLIKKKPKMTSKKRNKIHNIISAASERLFTMHSNLSVIEPSAVKSSKDGENIIDCPCIAIVCIGKGKRPIGEPLFPTEIEGIKIDVREGFYVPFTCHSCSVGVEEIKSTGSYGFLAHKTGNRSKEGMITSAHVVVEDDVLSDIFESTKVTLQRHELKNERVELFSPSSLDSKIPKRERIYGIVCDIYCGEWQNDGSEEQSGVEAAFVEKSEESQVTLNFHITSGQLSHPIFDPNEILYGDVEKCGRTTERTTGKIIETDCSIKWDISSKPFITLKSQYKIGSKKEFATLGDSGSGVHLVRNGKCHPIGIVEGGLLEGGHSEQCYVTPIGSILGALDLHIIPENGIIDTTHEEN